MKMILLHKFVLFLHILAIAGSVDQNFSLHFSVVELGIHISQNCYWSVPQHSNWYLIIHNEIWATITNQVYCGLEIIYMRIFLTLNPPKITLLHCLWGVCIKCQEWMLFVWDTHNNGFCTILIIFCAAHRTSIPH